MSDEIHKEEMKSNSDVESPNPPAKESEKKISQDEPLKETVEKEEKAEAQSDIGKDKQKEKEPPFDFNELIPDKIEDIVRVQLLSLNHWAYVHMGLLQNPKTKKVEKDLRQARIAIDATSALVDVLIANLSDSSEQRELKNMVINLRMNFMSKSQEG